MSPSYEVVVVGGGAAGLIAAGRAASLGRRVLLLEKNRKLGVKILMSGGTRCNVTHDCGPREIADAIGDPKGRFLYPALGSFPPQAIVSLLESEGVAVKVESTGKVFPCSDRAIDVRDALVRWAQQAGAELRPGTAVKRLVPFEQQQGGRATTEEKVQSVAANKSANQSGTLFRIELERGEPVVADRVILATGGKSYPGCGTTGDGFVWAKELGHTIVPPVPALTPITTNDPTIRDLAGVTLPRVAVAVIDPQAGAAPGNQGGAILASNVNSVLFTHVGFSGPGILNVSHAVARHATPGRLELRLDLLPDVSAEELNDTLAAGEWKSGGRTVANALTQISDLPKRLVSDQLQRAGVRPALPLAELSRDLRRELVKQLKSGRYPISGVLGFDKAEVTTGGVKLAEVNRKSMESRICPGLFLAGEILDLDGPIGGYNFQIAFSTGWLAATSAAASIG